MRAVGVAGLWGILILPPLSLTIAGRGGTVFPIEVLAPLVALVVLWRERFRIRSCPSLGALALFLILSLPSTFKATDLARHCYGLMVFGVAGVVLYMTTAARFRTTSLRDFIRLAPLPFVVLALVVLGTAWSQGHLVETGHRKMLTLYGGSNFLASMLLLGAFVPFGVAIGGATRGQRGIAALAFGLIVAAILATGSRLGMGVLPLGCGVTALILKRGGRARPARFVGPILVLGLVLLLLMPYLGGLMRTGRFRNPLEQRNWVARMVIFDLYWREFCASPWVGNGFLNTRADPELAVLGEGGSEGWGANVGAHNWLLQSLADAGVLGGVGFGMFLLICGRTFRAGLLRSHPWFPYSAGWMAGFVAVVLHGLFEPNFHGKPFIYLFAVQLGLAEQVRRAIGAVPLDGRQARTAVAGAARILGRETGPAPRRPRRLAHPPPHSGTALA